MIDMVQLAGTAEFTDCFSEEGYDSNNVCQASSTGAAEYTNCISAGAVRPHNECSVYDTKQSDGEAPIMLELWGMQSTPLLQLLPDPLFLEWYHLIVSYQWVK